MRTLFAVALAFAAAPAAVALSACDTAFLFGPPRTIDNGPRGEGEGEAAGEGEGGAGEGEGEGASAGVCGGSVVVTASAPLPMITARARHAAVLLADGRVLLAGGDDGTGITSKSAELFDPANSTFTATGPLLQARYDFAMVALDDGRAIAFGGFNNDIDTPADNGDLPTSEIWDPSTAVWTAGPAMPEARDALSAEKVAGGKVLVFGGQTDATSIPTEVLLFDASNDSLTTTPGNIRQHGTAHTSHVLKNGLVLMAGGFFTQSLTDVDILFADGHTAPADGIPGARRSACAANDDKGNLLVFGGYNAGEVDDVESFDPLNNAWSSVGTLHTPRAACEAAELSCLTLVCGSFASTGCEAWDYATASAVDVGVDVGVNFAFTLTRIDDAHALLAGGTFNDFDSAAVARVISLEAP